MVDKPKKFMFDLNDFSNQKPVNEEDLEHLYSEDELNTAREESFSMGVEEATNKIRNEHEERSVQTLESITEHLSRLIESEQRRELEKNLDTTKLTLSIVKKLMPRFSKNYAEEEIIALVRQSLKDRPEEARIVVVVHDRVLETLRQKINDITTSQAFQETDCRVEWADGGIEKDFDRLYQTIERAFHTVMQRLDTSSDRGMGIEESLHKQSKNDITNNQIETNQQKGES